MLERACGFESLRPHKWFDLGESRNTASFGLAIERGGIQQMTLDWTVDKAQDPGWWDARLTGDAEGRSYRIVRRDSEPYFELRVVLGETRLELPFSTLEDAMGAAQNLEAAQTHEPHQKMGREKGRRSVHPRPGLVLLRRQFQLLRIQQPVR